MKWFKWLPSYLQETAPSCNAIKMQRRTALIDRNPKRIKYADLQNSLSLSLWFLMVISPTVTLSWESGLIYKHWCSFKPRAVPILWMMWMHSSMSCLRQASMSELIFWDKLYQPCLLTPAQFIASTKGEWLQWHPWYCHLSLNEFIQVLQRVL